jgi:hypothetical protein
LKRSGPRQTMLDANTGKPRIVVDIEKAAKLWASEESRDGFRIRKYAAARIAHRPRPTPCPQRRTRLHESFSGRLPIVADTGG